MHAELPPRRARRGFTLLEVLVALLLLSLALVGLVRMTSLEARALAQTTDATLGQWVASNAIAELRLRESQPRPGVRDGRAEMGGRQWRWQMRIEATEVTGIARLDVQVFADGPERLDDADPVATLTGFSVP